MYVYHTEDNFYKNASKEDLIKELAQIRQEFVTLTENSSTVISRFDPTLTCTYVNKAVQTLTGLAPHDIIGKRLAALSLPKAFYRLWTNHLRSVFQTSQPLTFSSKYRSMLGKEIFYRAHFIPEFNEYGKTACVLCSVHDITTLKNTEHDLRLTKARYKWFLDAIPDLLFKYDRCGNYLDFSGSTKELLHRLPPNFIGQNIKEVLPLSLAEKITTAIQLVHDTQTVQSIEYDLTLNDQVSSYEGRITACHGRNEFLLIVRDITELKELRNKIDRSNRLHFAGELASILGHEIRNPLTTVRGFLQLMLRKSEYKDWKDQIELMISELDHSNKIITNFLSLSHVKDLSPNRQGLEEIIAKLKA